MSFRNVVLASVAFAAMALGSDSWAGKTPDFHQEITTGPLYNISATGVPEGTVLNTGVGEINASQKKNGISADILYTGKVTNASGKKFRVKFGAYVVVESLDEKIMFKGSFEYLVMPNGDATVTVTLSGKGFQIPDNFDPSDLPLPFFVIP